MEEYGDGFLIYAKNNQRYLKLLQRLENDDVNNNQEGLKKIF